LSDGTLPEVPDGIPWKIVLGIDPGTQVVGYGAVVLRPERPTLLAAGVLRATRSKGPPERLGEILAMLEDLMGRLKPDIVVVERVFSDKNVQSAIRIGEGRGLALATAARRGALVVEIAPAAAKRALVGNGRADKEQVARMVATELHLDEPPRPHDATDALALALTYVHRSGVAGRL
jgi:crossover junction endodeoxyribonuclease RuvC